MLPFMGILMSNNALKLLLPDLQRRFCADYILTRRLNQDVLENFFGVIRAKGCLHDHPNALEFKYRLRSYIMGKNEGAYSDFSNVETDDTPDLHLVQWSETKNTELFWVEVALYRHASNENPFSDIINLAFKILCLPHSNADIERMFSVMDIVKNKLRNKMKLPLLNNILNIKFGLKRVGKCCNNYLLPDHIIKVIDTKESYCKETVNLCHYKQLLEDIDECFD
jgi:hypothetical protein